MNERPDSSAERLWLQRGAIVFAALTALAAFWRPEGAWPLLILSAACLVVANLEKINDDIFASIAGMSISIIRKKAEKAVDQMNDSAQRLASIETTIGQLAHSLDAKTEEMIGNITGGNSSPILIVSPGTNNSLSEVRVGVLGKYSLRDVRVQIVSSLSDVHPFADVRFEITHIPARHVHWLPSTTLGAQQPDSGRLVIFFTAVNGRMFQFLDFRKVDGKWFFATRVLAHGQLMLQQIDEGFGPQPNWAEEIRRIGVVLESETPESLRAKGIEDDFTGWTKPTAGPT